MKKQIDDEMKKWISDHTEILRLLGDFPTDFRQFSEEDETINSPSWDYFSLELISEIMHTLEMHSLNSFDEKFMHIFIDEILDTFYGEKEAEADKAFYKDLDIARLRDDYNKYILTLARESFGAILDKRRRDGSTILITEKGKIELEYDGDFLLNLDADSAIGLKLFEKILPIAFNWDDASDYDDDHKLTSGGMIRLTFSKEPLPRFDIIMSKFNELYHGLINLK